MEAMRETLESQRARLSLDVEEGKSGAKQELERVEDELAQVYKDDERAILAANERQRRTAERGAKKKADARVESDEMLADLERDFMVKLEALQEKAKAPRSEVEPVYFAGKLAYTWATELYGLTDDSKYRRRWDLEKQLGQHAAVIWDFFTPNRPKPQLTDKPWEKLLKVLQEV